MPTSKTPQQLNALQFETDRIRNLCILAHVDHGKTTFTDSLISSNGIISTKLAGKIRYLDNTKEEQLRGITMKSSAISLTYTPTNTEPYLINLIDSPGHVDFSFDVSTAIRLSDGAIILIDAVEGICPQTITVFRQAWNDDLPFCLILNKLDRLILELRLDPTEAYQRLKRILEQANALISTFIRDKVLNDSSVSECEIEKQWLLSPSKGNVLFASAIDTWAFGIQHFALAYADEITLNNSSSLTNGSQDSAAAYAYKIAQKNNYNSCTNRLRQILWGDFYYDRESKKVYGKPFGNAQQIMFVEFILKRIWNVYKTLFSPMENEAGFERVKELARELNVLDRMNERELRHSDRRVPIRSVMSEWLPLASTVLRMVTRKLPNVKIAQLNRCAYLFDQTREAASDVINSIERCASGDSDVVVVYVCKMVSVRIELLSNAEELRARGENEYVYVAIGRVFSGVLKIGQPLHVISENEKKPMQVAVNQVLPYLLMGREFFHVTSVPVGNIVGIVGLDDSIPKSATLSSSLNCPIFKSMPFQTNPIVRVAVEPKDPRDYPQLEAGLQRLYRSDPVVQVQVQENGEHVIVALGELHLENCIRELEENYANIPIHVSDPIVHFRETIIPDSRECMSESVMEMSTSDKSIILRVRAIPLPAKVVAFLEAHGNDIVQSANGSALKEEFQEILHSESKFWQSLPLSRIWSCGPRHSGPNLLINNMKHYNNKCSLFGHAFQEENSMNRIENSILTGFQMASAAGPLCEEPMTGAAFLLEEIVQSEETGQCGPLGGQIMSVMKNVCRLAFMKQPMRLVEAMYMCSVQCHTEQLGKLYSVLNKRRGVVVSEELADTMSLFTIQAHVPVIESFGLATEIRIQTSGAASNPQLVFSHWGVLEMDPFFQPQTEEEREDFGERVSEMNPVKRYIEAVRKRKGLMRDEKVVVHAEKQRTLARKR